MSNRNKKGRHIIRSCIPGIFAVSLILGSVCFHFGGFGTGKAANVEDFSACAEEIEKIEIPENTRIVALGEATHGNAEFQRLKLDVFKIMVENYGIRAFALEGDFGGCEQANRYIHGGDGTADEAAAAIGFAIYRTEEMAALLSYMREYNETALPGDDLRFYGFDMQRLEYNCRFFLEYCRKSGVECADLEELTDGDGWRESYSRQQRKDVLLALKEELMKQGTEDAKRAIHFADILLQNMELGEQMESGVNIAGTRDQFMAENTLWILRQEEARGRNCIFISGHNGHLAQAGSYDSEHKIMGNLLSDALGDGYYAIGTDFYKTCCNLPVGNEGKRADKIFYSRDPLAKAAKQAGMDVCWLDFSRIPEESGLREQTAEYTYMGSLGEMYVFYMRLLPQSYRIFQSPSTIYDGMIFVTNATPTRIRPPNTGGTAAQETEGR